MTGGESRGRRRRLPAVALRRRLPRPGVRRAEAAREVYRYYYRLRYPLDSSQAGRGRRLQPAARPARGARARCSRPKNGWERADYFDPGGPGARRRRGPARVRLERAAVASRCSRPSTRRSASASGIIDLTSFGKIEVAGPGRSRCSSASATTASTAPLGSVVYTQFLNAPRRDRRRPDGDAARARSASGRHRRRRDRLRPRLARRCTRDADGAVTLRDVTDELAVIGIWGPRARDVLAAVTDDDVSDEALPYRQRARDRRSAAPRVLAQRITFVGELGYELYVAPEWAVAGLGPAGGRRRARTGSAPAATACSSRCGSRRATATSAAT